MITKDTSIEELVNNVPGAVKYLMEQGIRCIVCGEPIWGTLEEAAEEKGFGSEDIEKFVKELNEIQQNPPKEDEKLIDKKIDVKKIDPNK
jgi:iron-sulfur cluster repair protein YtfE (RIC family)